jgi:hypothetical protein
VGRGDESKNVQIFSLLGLAATSGDAILQKILMLRCPGLDNLFSQKDYNAMKQKLALISLLVLFMATLLAGCCGGGSKKTQAPPPSTTVVTPPATPSSVGDELLKLKEAYDKGAMTQEEYEKAKEKILQGK